MSTLKEHIETMGNSANPLVRAAYRGIKKLGALRRFIVNPRVRSQTLTRVRYGDRHFQGEATSFDDRYPDLFAECRRRLESNPSPRILSFGCATGEEVFTLARYLPLATITGVDINPWCLKQCERKRTSENVSFVHRLSPEFEGAGDFDAIFCMAVFQRTEHRTNGAQPADTGFTFQHFESEVALLDGMLKPGGLFFIDQGDFSFEHTTAAQRYTPADFEGNRALRRRPLFDRDNRLISDEHSAVRCFVKDSSTIDLRRP